MKEQMKYRICVAVGRPDMMTAIQAAMEMTDLADVIEIRLDCISDAEAQPFIDTIRRPLLFTNRPTWEGGQFAGSEIERIDQLAKAVQGGAAYIDLELQAPAESLRRLQAAVAGKSTKIILSYHNFKTTPPRDELLKCMHLMRETGAHIGKIITMAHTYLDVLRVLQLQEEASAAQFPLIAFCMGRAGVISRFATLELGGYMTYCAVGRDEATAPGQVTVQEIRSFLGLLDRQSVKQAELT